MPYNNQLTFPIDVKTSAAFTCGACLAGTLLMRSEQRLHRGTSVNNLAVTARSSYCSRLDSVVQPQTTAAAGLLVRTSEDLRQRAINNVHFAKDGSFSVA
jgi:hypothetical protein